MTVERYLFQTPYSSQVQYGRPDPSVEKEEVAQNTDSEAPNTNETSQKAQQLQSSQTTEVEPKVSSSKLLDIYA